jgi:DNA-binding LytR/AlgR family response regulator
LILAGICCFGVVAQTIVPINSDQVIICPAPADTDSPPGFDAPNCKAVTSAEIDPQNTAIWVKASLELPLDVLKNDQPYAIYIFAKTSSRVFFNGTYLGQNGTPSALANQEFAGRMDATFYLPPALLQKKSNELVLHLSSHHGFLQLKAPIHFIGLGSYALPTNTIWQDGWLSLIPFGALMLGALYFAVASLSPYQRQNNILFFVMAFFAASQLLAEIARYLFSYAYPMHDVRLLLIVCLALGFGCSFWLYNVLKFATKHRWWWLGVGVGLIIAVALLLPGFDSKTASAMLTPTLLSILLIVYRLAKWRTTWQIEGPTKEQTKAQNTGQTSGKVIAKSTTQKTSLWLFLGVYLLLTVSILVTFGRFHDSLFYYIISAVLGFLFVQQALEFSKEQARRKTEQQQVALLQLKLDQLSQQHTPHKIKISSAGKVEWVATDKLVYCKAAGDYTELFFSDQKSILYSGNLKELESQLPTTFLRVHRSYVVNTDFIAALEKSGSAQQNTAASVGFLVMTSGEQVPVSRRILPMVRSVLT